jgi:AraC-like DNA-binding protein
VSRDRDLFAEEMLAAANRFRIAVHMTPEVEESAAPVARGWYAERAIERRMFLIGGDVRLLQTLTHAMTVPATVFVGVTFRGTPVTHYAGNEYRAEAGRFFGLSLREPIDWWTLHRAGDVASMTGLMIDRAWMEEMAADYPDGANVLSRFLDSHMDLHTGIASAAVRAAAHRMMTEANADGPLGAMRSQAAALDFTAAFFALLTDSDRSAKFSAGDRRRMAALGERLDAIGPGETPTLEELAKEFGYSVSTLCRRFRGAYGVSIGRYLTDRRLQRARESLVRKETTIAEAAYAAGFSSQANFSVAFKRTFGVSPGAV